MPRQTEDHRLVFAHQLSEFNGGWFRDGDTRHFSSAA
jgi:hypothetical protein